MNKSKIQLLEFNQEEAIAKYRYRITGKKEGRFVGEILDVECNYDKWAAIISFSPQIHNFETKQRSIMALSEYLSDLSYLLLNSADSFKEISTGDEYDLPNHPTKEDQL